MISARDMGPLPELAGVAGREGGASVLAWGRVLWMFGYTTLSEPDALGSRLRSSTWTATLDLYAEDGVGGFTGRQDGAGGPAELLPYTTEELAFNDAHAALNPDCEAPCGARRMLWPLSAVRDTHKDELLVFYAKYEGTPGPGGRGQVGPVGSSIAIWGEFEFGPVRPVLDPGAGEPTLLFTAPEPEFGQASLIIDGRLYAFGCTDRQVEHPCLLARVAVDQVFTRAAWRFWSGVDWSPALADAVPVFDGARTLSVYRNHHVDRYLAIYPGRGRATPEGDRAEPGTVVLRHAPSLEGPWSEAERAFEAELGLDGSGPRAVSAHPEYSRGGGRFEYVSYVRALGPGTSELRLVELELEPKTATP